MGKKLENKADKFDNAPISEEEINDSGVKAIEEEFERLGLDQVNHYGVLIPWRLGGPDPLDGISIYDGGDYWHFVTFGLTELYDKESEDREYSGYGMEFTFKLKKSCCKNEEEEIRCVCGNLQNLAKVTFNDGELFLPFEYVYTGRTVGIDREQRSALTGFITIPDPTVNTLDTPNGKVEFVEFIGVCDKELKAIMDEKITVKELYEKIGSDVTDYSRKSAV